MKKRNSKPAMIVFTLMLMASQLIPAGTAKAAEPVPEIRTQEAAVFENADSFAYETSSEDQVINPDPVVNPAEEGYIEEMYLDGEHTEEEHIEAEHSEDLPCCEHHEDFADYPPELEDADTILEIFEETLVAEEAAFAATESWLWPVDNVYHMSRGWTSGHQGLDIANGKSGHVIRASKSGVVINSGNSCPHDANNVYCDPNRSNVSANYCAGGQGNYVKIKHLDGTYSRYLHLKKGSAIPVGTQVKQGDQVGIMASSGHSTGWHLHFDLYDTSNKRINSNPTDSRHSCGGAIGAANISYIYSVAPPQPVKPSKPTVSVSFPEVRVSWNDVANETGYDVYLIQAPWGWGDVKYHASVTANTTSCVFRNVAEGTYNAFVISRPNADSVQSDWTEFTVRKPPEIYTILLSDGDRYLSAEVEFGAKFYLPPNNSQFTRAGYTVKGFYVSRLLDDKWYVQNVGWLTEEEIMARGLEKQLFGSDTHYTEFVFDEAWTTGLSDKSRYLLLAEWEALPPELVPQPDGTIRCTEKGVWVTNALKTIDGDTYWFDETGVAVRNTRKHIGDDDYYFDGTGKMVKDKLVYNEADKSHYYYDSNGKSVKRKLQQYNGHLYYFGNDGKLLKNTQKGTKSRQVVTVEDKVYGIQHNGIAYKNAFKYMADGNYYFFQEDGTAFTGGLKEIKGNLYYFNTDGRVSRNKAETIDGDTYYFGGNGKAFKNRLKTYEKKSYFFGSDRKAVKNTTKMIDGVTWKFDENGVGRKVK